MNAKLLRRVKARILAEPERLDMNSWHCESANCIGGWAVVLIGYYPIRVAGYCASPRTHEVQSTHDVAPRVLDLNDDESGRLFYVKYWPPSFRRAYNRARLASTKARVAGERIDHFIRSKGRD